jgi:hypothetical protein
MTIEIIHPAPLPAPEEFGIEWMVEDHGTKVGLVGGEGLIELTEDTACVDDVARCRQRVRRS